jgi:hypothetical protein
MDITAVFRGDRFRLACGIASRTPETARNIGYKACPARMLRLADCRRPAIVAVCGINGVATQDDVQMDIATIFRGDHCRVVSRKTCENPWDSSNNAWDKKKFRGSGQGLDPPPRRKSLAKRGFSIAEIVQNAPIRATKQRQRRQKERSIRGSGPENRPPAPRSGTGRRGLSFLQLASGLPPSNPAVTCTPPGRGDSDTLNPSAIPSASTIWRSRCELSPPCWARPLWCF